MIPLRRRVWCLTLGCDKNLVDSENLLGRLVAAGAVPTARAQDADIWILNTCSFIEPARIDSWAALRELAEGKGAERVLAVVGCLGQDQPARIAREFPAVDVVAGVGNHALVAAAILAGGSAAPLVSSPGEAVYDGYPGRHPLTPAHVAFVKIAEGCSCACAFCRIPAIRGPQRSRRADDLVAEVEGLVERGVREVQLVSQNSSAWGRDIGDSLPSLIARLDRIEGLRWIRLLYLFPGQLTLAEAQRILDCPRVVPYLDLPIQHASPRLLRTMRRPTDTEAMARFCLALREQRPDLVLRTTVLLGFPGEEEEDVEALADYLARVEFDHAGAYRYSPEAGTAAAALAHRPPAEEVADREARIMDLQAEISLARQRRRLGRAFPAVIDAVVPAAEAAETVASLREAAWAPSWNRAAVARVLPSRSRIAIARTQHYGYDLDGVILLAGERRQAGEWVQARLIGVTAFDGLAVCEDEAHFREGGMA